MLQKATWSHVLLACSLWALLPQCSGTNTTATLILGRPIDVEKIDKNPLLLLPRDPILAGYLDAQALFASTLAPELSQALSNVMPIGPESNFIPSRDVQKIYAGIYAMQGADFCFVMQGNFDPMAIAQAAKTKTRTPSTAPLVQSQYAGTDMYTSGNIGFVVLSKHTILAGSETGMRRALDRIRDEDPSIAISPWMMDLFQTPNAAFALAGDLSTQPATESMTGSLPFLARLRLIRIIGNFKPPGINFVGTLTYEDASSASSAVVSLRDLEKLAKLGSLFLTWGSSAPPQLQTEQRDKEVLFALPLENAYAKMLLRSASDALFKFSSKPSSSSWNWR